MAFILEMVLVGWIDPFLWLKSMSALYFICEDGIFSINTLEKDGIKNQIEKCLFKLIFHFKQIEKNDCSIISANSLIC